MKHENRRLIAFIGLAIIWLCIGASLGYEYGYERGKKAVYNKVDSLLRKQHDQPIARPENTQTATRRTAT